MPLPVGSHVAGSPQFPTEQINHKERKERRAAQGRDPRAENTS